MLRGSRKNTVTVQLHNRVDRECDEMVDFIGFPAKVQGDNMVIEMCTLGAPPQVNYYQSCSHFILLTFHTELNRQ